MTGWRAAAIPGRVYPALVPVLAPEAQCPGFVLLDLVPEEWAVLDAFEDPIYDLRVVDLDGGQSAWAYACPADVDVDVEEHDWDAVAFQTDALASYIARCRSWREAYES